MTITFIRLIWHFLGGFDQTTWCERHAVVEWWLGRFVSTCPSWELLLYENNDFLTAQLIRYFTDTVSLLPHWPYPSTSLVTGSLLLALAHQGLALVCPCPIRSDSLVSDIDLFFPIPSGKPWSHWLTIVRGGNGMTLAENEVASHGRQYQHVLTTVHSVARRWDPLHRWYTNLIGFEVTHGDVDGEDTVGDDLVDTFDLDFLKNYCWITPTGQLTRTVLQHPDAVFSYTSLYRPTTATNPTTLADDKRSADRVHKYLSRGAIIPNATQFTSLTPLDLLRRQWPQVELELLDSEKADVGARPSSRDQELNSIADHLTGVYGQFVWQPTSEPRDYCRGFGLALWSFFHRPADVRHWMTRNIERLRSHWSNKSRDLKVKYDAELWQMQHIIDTGFPLLPSKLNLVHTQEFITDLQNLDLSVADALSTIVGHH